MTRFDPFGWLEQAVPARRLHQAIRRAALVAVLSFLVARITQYNNFSFKPLWLAETLLFFLLVVAFAVRSDPVDRSRGVAEIVVPLVGSVLPFGLLATPPGAWIMRNDALLAAVFCWMTVATGFTTWGLWTLRRSFSVTVEARSLVTDGPYRWVRHPVYLGEILAAAAVVVWRWSFLNCAMLVLFVVIQLFRARREEVKLSRTFSTYKAFAEQSWWFWRVSL